MIRLLLAATSVLLLAACEQPQPPTTATLALSPPAIRDCGKATHPVPVTITWDASRDLPNGSIKLWLNDHPSSQALFGGENLGKLWSQNGPKGSATTGAWMLPGSRIIMTNAANGDVLVRLDIRAAPCH